MDQMSGFSWTPIGGQSGSAASVASFATGLSVITGLTGMTAASVLHFLTQTGCATSANNGTFQIVAFLSATSVVIANTAGVAPDANNGSIGWTESTPALSFPATVGVPDDGDAWDSAEFAPGYEGLLQRTAQLSYGALKGVSLQFDVAGSGSFTVPPGCFFMFVCMCGGGGGGEGGSRGEVGVTNAVYPQGGGGAGAPLVTIGFATTPGDTIHWTVGAGGAGGAAGGGAGVDGGSSHVTDGAIGFSVDALGARRRDGLHGDRRGRSGPS